ncbi:MAG: hypothetical protein IKM68_01375 [Bacteroidaceae bacterium]|nr:hypothetical protein [Bacteroidaceae bacterium]
MKTLAEIFYDAITADAELMEAVGSRVETTCFEVPPGEDDNTPLPNIIITNDGFQNNTSTKDYVWESAEDVVQASVDVAAGSHKEVEMLISKVRQAIENHIVSLYNQGEDIPQLQQGYPQANELAWDWMKPCYYQAIVYQCTLKLHNDEQTI